MGIWQNIKQAATEGIPAPMSKAHSSGTPSHAPPPGGPPAGTYVDENGFTRDPGHVATPPPRDEHHHHSHRDEKTHPAERGSANAVEGSSSEHPPSYDHPSHFDSSKAPPPVDKEHYRDPPPERDDDDDDGDSDTSDSEASVNVRKRQVDAVPPQGLRGVPPQGSAQQGYYDPGAMPPPGDLWAQQHQHFQGDPYYGRPYAYGGSPYARGPIAGPISSLLGPNVLPPEPYYGGYGDPYYGRRGYGGYGYGYGPRRVGPIGAIVGGITGLYQQGRVARDLDRADVRADQRVDRAEYRADRRVAKAERRAARRSGL